MTPFRSSLLAALAALALAGAACRDADGGSIEVGGGPAPSGAPFDWSRPRAALAIDAGEAARRLGSFEWTAEVSWNVHRGEGTRSSSASERHRLVQAADGAFEVESVVDDGRGPGSETGKHIVHAGGRTWAKGRWGPFRERSNDRGHDARRFRDESFRLAADLAALCGPGLALVDRGATTALGRPARRFALSLDRTERDEAEPPPEPAGRGTDSDTQLRVEFLERAVPRAVEGEILADDATGVPLRVRMAVTLGVPGDSSLRADVTLDARVTALGGAFVAVKPPEQALPDERRPRGVAKALEAAGLKEARKPGRPGAGEGGEPVEEAPPPE